MAPTEHGIRRGTPAFRRVTVALFLGGFVTFANLYSVQPLLPLLVREFGVSPSDASLAVSVTTAALAVCLMLTAHLSDRWGRKPVMTLSMLASSALALASALSPTFGTLLVTRALAGAFAVTLGLPAGAAHAAAIAERPAERPAETAEAAAATAP